MVKASLPKKREINHWRGARLFCWQLLMGLVVAHRSWLQDHLYQFRLSSIVGEEEGTFVTKERGFCCKRLMSNAATRCWICFLCKLDEVRCDTYLGELIYIYIYIYIFADLSDVFGDMLMNSVIDVGWLFLKRSQKYFEVPTQKVESS